MQNRRCLISLIPVIFTTNAPSSYVDTIPGSTSSPPNETTIENQYQTYPYNYSNSNFSSYDRNVLNSKQGFNAFNASHANMVNSHLQNGTSTNLPFNYNNQVSNNYLNNNFHYQYLVGQNSTATTAANKYW